MDVAFKCVVSVCTYRKDGGKELRFEAPAKRIGLAAVSFRRVKDYERTTNEHMHSFPSTLYVC